MSEESRIDGLQKIGALQAEHEFIKPDAWLGRCSGLIYTNVTRIAVEQWVANLSKPMSAASITPLYRVQIPVISSLANERILLKDRIAELEREIAKKDALLRECRGHLRGYKMSMLAYTPERLIAAIDAALKEQSKCVELWGKP